MTAEQLEALSKAAAQAFNDAMQACDAGDQQVLKKAAFENTVAHEKLASALVNLYRQGQLILVDDAAVERVRQGVWNALRDSHKMPREKVPNARTDITAIATAAIAAMGSKP